MKPTAVHRQPSTLRTYVLAVFAASVAAVLLIMSHGFSKTLTPVVEEYKEVVVRDGDTLWQIAGQHRGPGTDTRRMVDRIREVNELSNAVVRPGQVLKIPLE